MIKCLVLLNGINLICKVEEIDAELGDPNCKITEVFLISDDNTISPWLTFADHKDPIMLRSENILTIVEPSKETLKSYLEVTS
jgi:predicted mannosyl-3-phosphoglycerate phosphatase (HAD superfamily)